MTWTKETATKYKNDFAKEAYDQLRVNVKKGQREQIQAYAKSKGMSLNGYINKLIAEDMGEALTVPKQQQED